MRILLVKLSSLGDVLVSSSLPRLICELSQDYSVDHLVMEHCAQITKFNPYVKNQVIVPFLPSGSRFRDLFVAFDLVKKIRHAKYDKAFIFHRSPLIAILLKLGGVREIYGFENKKNYFLNSFVKYTTKINRTTLEENLLHLGGLVIRSPEKLDFYPDPECVSIDHLIPVQKFIACNPGGGNPHSPADNRMWPVDHYVKLINSSPLPFVILGHGQSDLDRVDIISKQVNAKKIINLVGKTSLSETALILQRAALYVGNDSSLMFLGAAMGAKTLGLYGPTQVEAAAPIGKKQYAIRSYSLCAPCYDPYYGIKGKMYTCENNVCMKEISVEATFDKILEILDFKIGAA